MPREKVTTDLKRKKNWKYREKFIIIFRLLIDKKAFSRMLETKDHQK
jgi:hypothetical protein